MVKIHIKVTQTDVSIAEIEGKITAGNYNQILCTFDLSEEFNSLVVKGFFNGELVLIENGQCFAPVLKEGHCTLGVYGYSADKDGNLTLRISPSPCCFFVEPGSYNQNAAESQKPDVTVLEKLLSDINTAVGLANTAADTIMQKLADGEFNGPQGEPGVKGDKGEPGTTDYLELLNKPTYDIDIAGLDNFYFREQIPGSAVSPDIYRIVSSDSAIKSINNVYIDENHTSQTVCDRLAVNDLLIVYSVSDNTSDGYQLDFIPIAEFADGALQQIYLSSSGEENIQITYYATADIFELVVEMITNINTALNDFKTEEKQDIERLMSQTEMKLLGKADKADVPVLPEFITDNVLTESEIYGLDETNGVKTKRNINVTDGSITDSVANKYYSSMIPVTRKMQITAFSVGGGGKVNSQLDVAAVIYNTDGVMTSKICGEKRNITSNGNAEYSYEVTRIIEPSEDCAYIRLGSTQHYLLHTCSAKIYQSVEEKINALQEQINTMAVSSATEEVE